MVIISPAIPSEMVKLDPIEVSRPIGRISVVTIEKIPSITDNTASHSITGDRAGRPVPPGCEVAVVVEAMNSVLEVPFGARQVQQVPRDAGWRLYDITVTGDGRRPDSAVPERCRRRSKRPFRGRGRI
ncbi:hypothetical protein [Kitasatospora griseola]|uniref:hypothetical protein n=1 Tax=Kitasatospora griseola TaxID=2064 RepID=UPI0019A6B862|nr:hypothetical protein [Kitasatospora griseola]GGQ98308.1 hypothetical protein GCM10010195_62670 [Kitasatospora griseola]